MNDATVRVRKPIDDTIRYTTDYDMFKIIDTNRAIEDTRVDKIRESILEVGYLPVPILVNERYEIIDGQGRWTVAKEMGFALAYMVVPDTGIDECSAMNVATTPWGDWDYVKSYSTGGNVNYQRFVRLKEEFPWSSLSNVMMATTGKWSASGTIRSGNLRVTEGHADYAVELLSYVEGIWEKLGSAYLIGCLSQIANVVMFAYQCDGVDIERLKKVCLDHVEDFAKYRNASDQLKALSKEYNHGFPKRRRMHFDIHWCEDRGPDGWYGKKWSVDSEAPKGTGMRYGGMVSIFDVCGEEE